MNSTLKPAPRLMGLFLLVFLTLDVSNVAAQSSRPTSGESTSSQVGSLKLGDKSYSPDQVAAIDMLRSLSNDIRKEFANAEAIMIEARIADVFWNIDEAYARTIFRRAFDAASQPVENISLVDAKLRQQQLNVARRRASALSEVLRLLGKHDQEAAKGLLEKYESDKLDKQDKRENSAGQSELLAQIALELAEKDPQQAQRLGIFSLAGQDVPEAIEQLLFALSKHGKTNSDPIFVSLIENLRRNGYPYNNALNSLCNYVFYGDGRVFSKDYRDQASMLVGFLADATQAHLAEWRQSKLAGAQSISNSAASFCRFFLARVLPIIRTNAPDRTVSTEAALEELSRGLSKQQLQEAEDLAHMMQQERSIHESLGSGLDDQLKRAENEKDVEVRDNLWRIIATGIMRDDPERALSIAAKIDDATIRKQTEDDIRLVITAGKIKLRNYDEARKLALNLNDLALRARTLAAIATANKSAASRCDTELLSEAYSIAVKDEIRPEKVRVILSLASQFSKCGTERGFELLSAAIKVANQLPPVASDSSSRSNRRFRVETYTVVGGQELTTETPTTRESITFDDVAVFAKRDFVQAQNLGYQFDDHVLRAKYLIAIARSVLESTPAKSARN